MAGCALDVCYGCMEKNKKSPRWGGEGWRPIVCVMPKSNGKQAPPLSFAITPTVTRKARHSPPSPLRKKSRFAKKKSALPKKTAYRKKNYSIVWEACPCLCLCLCHRLRHPRSAIPSIDSIALRTPLSDSALNVGAQYFAPAPQCHPARLYSLSLFHLLMRVHPFTAAAPPQPCPHLPASPHMILSGKP